MSEYTPFSCPSRVGIERHDTRGKNHHRLQTLSNYEFKLLEHQTHQNHRVYLASIPFFGHMVVLHAE